MKKIGAFIVGCTDNNEKELGGIKVENYRSYISSSERIIIGLCQTKQDAIYEGLVSSGIKRERIIKLIPFISKLIMIF